MAEGIDMKKMAQMLHPLERAVLPHISKTIFSELVKKSGLKDVEVMRAVQWLENKGAVSVETASEELISLDVNGLKYKTGGLPERRFLESLKDGKEKTIEEVKSAAEISDEEINICIGSLKQKAAVDISKDRGLVFRITQNGKKILEGETLEEKFLKKGFPIRSEDLQPEEKFAFDNLKKRKSIIKQEIVKEKTITITELGKKLAKEKLDKDLAESLTPSMLKTGSWKGKNFRRYDIKTNVPEICGGKRHFVRQATEYAKRIWTDLGFREMEGPMLNTSFWNFDALFTAQDHPVRDLQDTFYIKNPGKGNLPAKKLVDSVKKAHEEGVGGSKGWAYKWNPEEAKKNVLRTHTTVLSAKTLSSLSKKDLPAKFFAVGRCFRNEAVDWSHLFEFNQTDGIVVDPNANFRHLLGYLREFFRKMGFEKARFRPAHFPYTEPSVEIDVYHPVHKKWVELGGAGMFRPEVVIPLLGEDIPVLAWGPGFDRILTEYYKITDLRDLYKNDIKQIRKSKFWLKG